ncbi:MAG: TIGR03016 family PEP-CTERM system-associated outer membrane protein [Proteobacteria bacterium]|nr:TIGR03016 family PEP-CTERM system-associated outer membrane protein [Pseudomonadota bacterium]
MHLRRNALASAIIAACAGYSAAQAQVLHAVPALPAQAESGAAPETVGTPPTTYISPSLAVLATETSNANFGTGLTTRSDTILQVVPRVVLISDHARWRVRGDFSLNGLYYARGTQINQVLPRGYLALNSEIVDRLFYFDARVQSQQNVINPYVGQAGNATSNQYTSTQYRISPYVDRLINPNLRFIARSDDTWTKVNNVPSGTSIFGGRYLVQTAGLDQRPLPWGYTLLARQEDASYDGLPYASLKDTAVRAIGNRAISNQLTLGLIAGYEKVQAFLAEENKPIYGVRGGWRPNAYGQVEGTLEHRYFGMGWNLQATGGTAISRFNLSWTRGPSTYLAGLATNAAPGTNITGLVDGLLLSQYPNPVQRAQAVQALLNGSGLPSGLAIGSNFYTSSATLQNNLTATALLLRERNSYALSIYRTKTEDLFLPGQSLLQAIQTLSSDNTQTGVAFNFGRRLSPIDNLNITVLRANNSGFGINEGRSARQTSFIAQFDHQFSPRTMGLVGLRRQFLKSTTVGNSSESAVFAGLVHRF